MKRAQIDGEESDEDFDNLPLKYISDHKPYISIKELRRYSVNTCEFCEKTFENRYDHLIHNASHIIIPLIKMIPNRCTHCGMYCISEEEMNEHMLVKHNIITANTPKDTNEDEKPLTYLIKNEVVQNGTRNILQNFIMSCKVDLEKFVPNCGSDKKYHLSNNTVEKCKRNFEKEITVLEPSIEAINTSKTNDSLKKIKSTEDEKHIAKSHVDYCDLSSEFSDVEDPIEILTPGKLERTEYARDHVSVHFEDLIKPGIFYCKRCYKRFPNRYEVIIHEVTHLDLSKAAPVSYKVNRNKRSVSTTVAEMTTTKHSKRKNTCERCHEEITDKHIHAQTCSSMYCFNYGKGFYNKTSQKAHEVKCNGEAIINLCDTCLYLRNRPKHMQYLSIVRLSKLEVKKVCHWCGMQCEDLSLVTILSRQRISDRIKFESDPGEVTPVNEPAVKILKEDRRKKKFKRSSSSNERSVVRGSKGLSNRERLKLIQQRLKMMKK